MWRYQFVTNAKLPLVEVWRYCDSLFISYSILCSWALWSMLTLTFDLFIWKLVYKLHVTYDNICKLCDNFGLFIAFYSSIKSRWRHNWKSAQVVSSHLVCDPTIWQPGFDLPRQQWSLLNSFLTEQGHCGACRPAEGNGDLVSFWWDPHNVPHCQILSPDKTELRLISATLCRWRHCFLADQLCFMTCIRKEEERFLDKHNRLRDA